MLTTAFVVVVRPFQLLLACASLAVASLDQFYLESDARIWILLGLIMPAALVTITVAVHTTFAYAYRHTIGSSMMTLRWILDLVALVLTTAGLVSLVLCRNDATYHMMPPVPFVTIVLITLSVNIACFLTTTVMLAVEDYAWRTRDQGDLPHRHRIEHTTYNEAIFQPRPLVAPKEMALVTERGVPDDPYDWRSPA